MNMGCDKQMRILVLNPAGICYGGLFYVDIVFKYMFKCSFDYVVLLLIFLVVDCLVDF